MTKNTYKISLTPYIYIYIILFKLNSNHKETHYHFNNIIFSKWDLFNLLKQKYRRRQQVGIASAR